MADVNNNGGAKKEMPMGGMCQMCGGSGTMPGGCCGWHGCGGHHFGWKILRVIVALIVLGIVFSVGVMVGELRGLMGGGFGRSPMRVYMQGGQGYYPMMGWQGNAQPAPTSTESK